MTSSALPASVPPSHQLGQRPPRGRWPPLPTVRPWGTCSEDCLPLALASPAGSQHTSSQVLERACMGTRGQQDSTRLSSQPPGQTRGEASILLEAKSAPPVYLPVCASRVKPGSYSLYFTTIKGQSHIVRPQLTGTREAKKVNLLPVPAGISLLDCDWPRMKGGTLLRASRAPSCLPSGDTKDWGGHPPHPGHGSLPLAQTLPWAVLWLTWSHGDASLCRGEPPCFAGSVRPGWERRQCGHSGRALGAPGSSAWRLQWL